MFAIVWRGCAGLDGRLSVACACRIFDLLSSNGSVPVVPNSMHDSRHSARWSTAHHSLPFSGCLCHVLSVRCGLMGNACVACTRVPVPTSGHRALCGGSSL